MTNNINLAIKIHTLALVCEASYRDGCAGLPEGMQVVRTIKAGSDVAYVVESTVQECPGLILVFRGSDDVHDWASNFALDLMEYPGIDLKFHRGFLDAVLRLSVVDGGFLRLTFFDWIVGHSRGGALAVIQQALRDNGSEMVTFGSPRAMGGEPVIRPTGLRHHRVVNREDIVPTVPPPTSMFGRCFHVPTKATDAATMEGVWSGQMTGNFEDHAIGEYVASLANFINHDVELSGR